MEPTDVFDLSVSCSGVGILMTVSKNTYDEDYFKINVDYNCSSTSAVGVSSITMLVTFADHFNLT